MPKDFTLNAIPSHINHLSQKIHVIFKIYLESKWLLLVYSLNVLNKTFLLNKQGICYIDFGDYH